MTFINEEGTEGITSIGKRAFYYQEGISSVTIPDTVRTIAEMAFENCRGLWSVTIGESVGSIGDEAFRECRNLESVRIPNSVVSVGNSAFSDCESLKSAIIGDSVETISIGLFERCTRLESVTIGKSVTSIGSGAFDECPLNTVYYNASKLELEPSDSCWPESGDILFIDANGGYVTGDAIEQGADGNIILPLARDFVPKGGFIEYKDGEGTSYQPGQPYTLTGKQVVYAIWNKCGYNLIWGIDENDALTIAGYGEMNNYNYELEFCNLARALSHARRCGHAGKF